ncbi:heterokaryon incompatibility protein-domain-containing protein [Halenospora varia]|nr:heterokaryon incompatibility protein-domain-containing protein [Halenospora varia]
MTTYQYASVAAAEFRLLEVHPGVGTTPMVCSLKANSLEDEPIYEALSYSWGDPSIRTTITCDGKDIEVTVNCQQALQHIRHSHKARIMWVDAICIDQSSIPERNQQVPLMGRIYRQASSVLIWLGAEAGQSDFAMTLLLRLKELRLKHERQILFDMMEAAFIRNPKIKSGISSGKDKVLESILSGVQSQLDKQTANGVTSDGLLLHKDHENEGIPGLTDPKWEILTKFFGRSWFSRVWVFQEVVLAKQATLFCGKKSISWEDLSLALNGMVHTLRPVSPAVNYANPLFMGMKRETMREEGNIDFLELLNTLKDFDCTDPRDRVYGVLGMTSRPSGLPWLDVDYSLSTTELFRKTTIAVLKDNSIGLDVLLFAQQPHRLKGLPSWSPDWTSRLPSKYLASPSWFRAAGVRDSSTQPAGFSISDDNTTIDVIASIVCSIAKLGSAMPAEAETDQELEILEQKACVYEEWREMIRDAEFRAPVYEGQSIEEAFWRTLVVDSGEPMTERADQSMEFNYKHFYSKLRFARRGFFKDMLDDPVVARKYSGGLCMMFGLQDPYFKAFYRASTHVRGYRFGILDSMGWFCLVPESAEEGDSIYVIKGLDVPFVVRGKGDGRVLIGPCFVQGLMDGRFTDMAEQVGVYFGNMTLK